MLLIVENNPDALMKVRHNLYRKYALNTCGATTEEAETALATYPVRAVYIPNAEALPDPIGFCRAFKLLHPKIPLIAAVPKQCADIDLDALYAVTDNIPLRPLKTSRILEIIYELVRLYEGRDYLHLEYEGIALPLYSSHLFYYGEILSFSLAEFSVIRYLLEAAPRPVTATELAANTCNPMLSKRTTRNIASRIYNLNCRAKAKIGRPLISRINKQGYCLLIPNRPL